MKQILLIKIIILILITLSFAQAKTETSSNGSYSAWNNINKTYDPAIFFDLDPPVKIILEESSITIAKTTYKLGKIILNTKDNKSSQVMWEATNTKKVKCKIKMVNHFIDNSIVIYAMYPSRIYGYLIDEKN